MFIEVVVMPMTVDCVGCVVCICEMGGMGGFEIENGWIKGRGFGFLVYVVHCKRGCIAIVSP